MRYGDRLVIGRLLEEILAHEEETEMLRGRIDELKWYEDAESEDPIDWLPVK